MVEIEKNRARLILRGTVYDGIGFSEAKKGGWDNSYGRKKLNGEFLDRFTPEEKNFIIPNDKSFGDRFTILSKQDLDYLRYCLHAEAAKHSFGVNAYGKTGTAQRTVATVKKTEIKEQDGWYMGYFDGAQGPIAFAVRLERGPGSGSAVNVVENVLMPIFKDKSLGYIK